MHDQPTITSLSPRVRPQDAWRVPVTWWMGVNVAALVLFACSPFAPEHPIAALAIMAVLLVQCCLPACRTVAEAPLCPANIAQFFFWVQLVLVTVLIGWFGFSLGSLPELPARGAIDLAICLRVLGYASFCLTYQWFSSSAVPEREMHPGTVAASDRSYAAALLVFPFVVIGIVWFMLAHGSMAAYLEFVTNPAIHRERELEPTSVPLAIATFLRPFLGFALVLAWSWWIQDGTRSRSTALVVVVTLLLAAVLLIVNFSYNRGGMLAPLLALAAAFSYHVRRVSTAFLALAGAVVLLIALALGSYRGADLDAKEMRAADITENWSGDEIVDFVQIYASGPQITGYMIDQLERDGKFYWGRTIVPSLLYPVPSLGRPLREQSGVAILNRSIYGTSETVDQVISYDIEFYMNFHIPGVILGYALLGWVVRFFQNRFMRAPTPAHSYAWLWMVLFVIFPGSLPVVSQIYVYFLWPVLGFLFLDWYLCRRTAVSLRPASAGVVGVVT